MPEGGLLDEVRALREQLYALESRLNGVGVDELPDARFDVLVCRVGNERVALALNDIQEVVPLPATSELPEAPAWVTGLFDLRGTVIPVLDVLARIGRRGRIADLSDLVVVAHHRPTRVGLLVQDVFDVGRVDPSEVQAPAGNVPHGPYLLGAFPYDDGACLLFSVPRLIAHSSIPELDPESTETGDAA